MPEQLLDGLIVRFEVIQQEQIDHTDRRLAALFPLFLGTIPSPGEFPLDLALDLKFCGSDNAEKRLIREVNDYIMAFGTKYGNLAFVVYDLGFIRDVDLFAGSFQQHQNVIVRIVKH